MVAINLTCEFEGTNSHELVRTVFGHPALESPVEARRGRWAVSSGTFPWTPAVKALGSLVLRTAAWKLRGCLDTLPQLEAHGAGQNSALDYALGREPRWITELFGIDTSGKPLSRLLFNRENPERKRAGPARIFFRKAVAKECLFRIYLGGSLCEDPQRLLEAAAELDDAPLLKHRLSRIARIQSFHSSSAKPVVFAPSSMREFFREALSFEVTRVLRYTDIFNEEKLKGALRIAQEHRSFKRIARKGFKLDLTHSTGRSMSQRLGSGSTNDSIRRTLDKFGPIKIGLTPGQSGALFLLDFLKTVREYPIEPVFHFAHTRDVAKDLTDPSDDILDGAVLSTATAASCLTGQDYVPLMVLPTATHRVIAPSTFKRNRRKANQGDFRLLKDFPTSPSFFLDELISSNWMSLKSVNVQHEEPDITTTCLREGDPDLRAVLWFPYDVLNITFNSCVSVEEKRDPLGYVTNILYLRKALYLNSELRECLMVALRDAWLSMLESPTLFDRVLESVTGQSNYIELMTRFSGINRCQQTVNH